MTILSGIILLLFSGLEVLAVNSSSTGLNPCDGPTAQIKILVEHTEGSPVYKYTVVNNHSHAILYFVFGKGHVRELLWESEHVPSDVRAPQGWRGKRIDGYENPYMSYFWDLTDETMTIKPGKALSGFELEMDALNPTMTSLAFRAVDVLGKCQWGRVELKP